MKNQLTPEQKLMLAKKAKWVRKETLLLHKRAPETRIASSLSNIEILVTLYYGDILKFDAKNPDWSLRDRLIISKGHGSISMYPILADLNYFNLSELDKICQPGSFLGAIPDPVIPGYETVNGSLGHGLGVGCGIALALKRKKSNSKVFVMVGDGELYEGSNWEAVMFAAHHELDNLILIVDHNKISMLDYCAQIIRLDALKNKFAAFQWEATDVDGHNFDDLHGAFSKLYDENRKKPQVLIAHTIKGKGVPSLENDSLCHVKSLRPEEVDDLVRGISCP